MEDSQLSVELAARTNGNKVYAPLPSRLTVASLAEAVGPVTSRTVKTAAEEAALVLPAASCVLK